MKKSRVFRSIRSILRLEKRGLISIWWLSLRRDYDLFGVANDLLLRVLGNSCGDKILNGFEAVQTVFQIKFLQQFSIFQGEM